MAMHGHLVLARKCMPTTQLVLLGLNFHGGLLYIHSTHTHTHTHTRDHMVVKQFGQAVDFKTRVRLMW